MRYLAALLLATVVGPLGAQQVVTADSGSPAPSVAAMRRAADGITADQVASYATALAADSMKVDSASGRGSDRAAQYVANQFAKLGLTASLQQYPLPGSRKMNLAGSRALFVTRARKDGKELVDENGTEMLKSVAVTFNDAARPGVDALPEGASGPNMGWGWFGGAEAKPSRVLVVSGRQTAATIAKAGLGQDVLLYVPPAGIDSAARQQAIDLLRRSGGVIVLSDDDAAAFERHRAGAVTQTPTVIEDYAADALGARHWVVYVRGNALDNFWRVAGFDIARLRADTTPAVHRVAGVTSMIEVQAQEGQPAARSAVNAIGILPGTDPRLSNDYVVVSTHLDPNAGNASSAAALVALAKAFSQSGVRPRRSLVFVATSGTVNGVGLGTDYFAQSPPVAPFGLAMALDDIGRGPHDSITVEGADDAELAVRPSWAAADHSELGLTVVEGGTVSDPSRDHFAFVRRAVPTLAFSGDADAGTSATATTLKDDPAKAAAVARLIFYVGQGLANAPTRPKWSTAGRQARLAALER